MPGVTIREVAKEAGVSIATASRALNGIVSVAPELAERVRASALRLGYVPNNVGRALRLQQSNSWAVIVQELNAFITAVVAAAENMAEQAGVSVYLGITGYDVERERRYLQASISQRVSGLIVGGASNPVAFDGIDVPVVFFDRSYPESRHDSVSIDNEQAGRLVADLFFDQGFRRIAYISDDVPGTPVAGRTAGFMAALAEKGIGIPLEYRRQTRLTLAGGKAAMLELLDLPEPPAAVFCVNGPTTQGAYLALQARREPEVALAGSDDEDWTSLATPTVTVVRQPVVDIGEAAARLIVQRTLGFTSPPQNVVLQPELIVRESSRGR